MGDEENRKLFVGGTRNADENLLQTYFQNYGEIKAFSENSIEISVVLTQT